LRRDADAVMGCLLGGAIGDAIGGVAERGRLSLSDDTQFTLATCESIVEAGRCEPAAVADAFLRWFRARRFTGLGSSTFKALRDLDAGAHWALSGAAGEMAAGNGGAMRAAPLAFLSVDRVVVRDVIRITHRNDEAYLGALAVILAMQVEGPRSLGALLDEVVAGLPDSRVRDQLISTPRLVAGGSLAAVAERVGSSGWVVESVPLALVAAWHMVASGFEATLDELVRIGGDTDTIASIAGQIAGAGLGLSRLPSSLVALVPERELVEEIGGRFASIVWAA